MSGGRRWWGTWHCALWRMASHESWMRQKVTDGWVFGAEKNPDRKEHPCLVPFDQLPREQQAKDFIFRAVVHALK